MYTGDLSGSEDTVREGIDVLVNQLGFPQDLKKINFRGDKNTPEISQPIPGSSNRVNDCDWECECGTEFITRTALNIHRKVCAIAKNQAETPPVEQHQDEWTECQAKPHCSKPVNLGSNWVACDFCHNWFHNFCVGVGPDPYPQGEDYYCKVCDPAFKPSTEGNASQQQHQPNAQYDFPNDQSHENQSFDENIIIREVVGGVLDPELNENALSNGVDDGGLFSSDDETEEPFGIFDSENENRHPNPSSGNFENVNTQQPEPSGSRKVVTPLKLKIPKPSKKRSIEGSSGRQQNGNIEDPANQPPAKRQRRPLEKVFCLYCNEEIPKNQRLRHAVSHYQIQTTRHKDKLIHTDTAVKCAISGCEFNVESTKANKVKFHLFQPVHKDLNMIPEMIEEVYGKLIKNDQPRNLDAGFSAENPNRHLIQPNPADPGP